MKTTNVKSFIAVLLFGLFFTFGQVASAQETKKSSEEKATMLTEKMKEKLSLDVNQYGRAYEINLKYIKKNEQLQKSSSRRMAKLKTLKANQDAKDKEMKAVLNSEQYKTYRQLQEQMKEEFKANRKNKE